MIERGILFSAKMVRALLDGRKTQTRRPVTLPKGFEFDGAELAIADFGGYEDVVLCSRPAQPTGARRVACPYGQLGDRLWVRERHSPLERGQPCAVRDASYVVFADGGQKYRMGLYIPGLPAYSPGAFDGIKWRPGIHMPRWASRLTLEITRVRVQHAHDISVEDVYAEGVDDVCFKRGPDGVWQGRCMTPQQVFGRLWDSVNSRRPGKCWANNPLVWAITFRVVPQQETINSQSSEATT